MDTSLARSAVEDKFQDVFRQLGIRESFRLELTRFSETDSAKRTRADDIARIISGIEKAELAMLGALVMVRKPASDFLKLTGKRHSQLGAVDGFRVFEVAKAVLKSALRPTHYALISSQGDDAKFHDARFFIDIGDRAWHVLLLIQDLLQFWEIFLAYETTAKFTDFSAAVRRTLVGRVADAASYWPLPGNLRPENAGERPSPSVAYLESEIGSRLGNVAFNIEEYESLQSELSRFTVRAYDPADPAHAQFRRLVERIKSAGKLALLELVHLSDTVGKLLLKRGRRRSELAVVQDLRLYHVASNFFNRLKHGVRGRGKDCAFSENESHHHAQIGSEPSLNDRVVRVNHLINYDGELLSLGRLIEDQAHLWELFLRNHLFLDLSEFETRFGRILLARKGLSECNFEIPTGVTAHAKMRSDERKRLDIE